MSFWNRKDDEFDTAYLEALQAQVARDSIQYVGKDRKPGLYWLVELYQARTPVMYCQIPPRKGYPCGFTFWPKDAYVWKHKWAAQYVAWKLSRGGKFNCVAAAHIWMK